MNDLDELNRQWERLGEQTQALFDEIKAICQKWGVSGGDFEELARRGEQMVVDADRAEQLNETLVELEEQQDALSEEIAELS